MGIEYCNNCNQHVNASRKGMGAGFVFLVFATIALLAIGLFAGLVGIAIFGGIVVVIWLVYWLAYAAKSSVCPLCKDSNWGKLGAAPVSQDTTPDNREYARKFNTVPTGKTAALAVLTAVGILVVVAFVIGSPAVLNQDGWRISPITAEYRAEILETPLEEWQWDEVDADRTDCLRDAVMYGGFDGRVVREMADDCHDDADQQIFDMRRANWEATKLEP